jgi:hypothetical protein
MNYRNSRVLVLATALLMAATASCVTIVTPGEETYYVSEYVTENRSEPFTETVPITTTVSGEDVLTPYIIWSGTAFMFKGTRNVWYYGYDLSGLPAHDSEKLKIAFSKQEFYEYTTVSLFDMTPRGQILSPPLISAADTAAPVNLVREMLTMKGETTTFDNWLNLANLKLNFALFLGGRSDLWLNYDGPYATEFSLKGGRDIAVIVSGPSVPQNMRFNVMRTWSDRTQQYITRSGERPVPYQLEKKVPKQRAVMQSRQAPFWELYLPR